MEETFYVVETENDIYLGRIQFIDGGIVIRNGFAGHPVTVGAQDIIKMYPAEMHPAVETYNYTSAI